MSTLKVEQIQHPDSSTPAISLDSSGGMGDASFANYPGRNRVINGGFDVWQRGTSQTANGYGSADRWNMNFSGATGTASQQEFTIGQTDVPGEPKYYLRFQTTVADNNSGPGQFIEDVRTFAGQTVTISFWGKADAAITIITQIQQNFGSGGSATQSSDSVEHTMSTTWQRYVSTITLPSIAGKTIGTNDHLRLWINNPNTETFTFDIWGVQLELGSVATPFEHRSYGDELARCQRYWEQTYNTGTAAGTNTTQGTQQGLNGTDGNQINGIRWQTPKRTTPTVTIYAKDGTVASLTDTNGNLGPNSGSWSALDVNEFGFRCVVGTGGLTTSKAYYYHYTANAEL